MMTNRRITVLAAALGATLLLPLPPAHAEVSAALQAKDLRAEYLSDPMGIDETAPRLSWKPHAEEPGQRQTAYQVLVASSREKLSPDAADLWNSQRVESARTQGVVYAGRPLSSRDRCYWKVRLWDINGLVSDSSESGVWTMGLLADNDWEAEWISFLDERTVTATREERVYPPARYYRTDFDTNAPVRRAILYATALGNYDVQINGEYITDARFLPGWADYRERVYYNTFDVTAFLNNGANAIGTVVADGWYSGYLGLGPFSGHGPYRSGRYFYGKTPAARLQLEIEYENGLIETVVTDPSWTVGTGAYTRADMLMGEDYDARKEPFGWSEPGFPATNWEQAVPAEENGTLVVPYQDHGGAREIDLAFREPKKIQAYPMELVRPTKELEPVEITEREPGKYIVNFGQNFAGVVRLKVEGPAGTRVRLRHGEMLHLDGSLMTENLRSVEGTDHYTLRGDEGGEVYEPRLTFHGFQFVEVSNYPGRLTPEKIRGIVLHSDIEFGSDWHSSDPALNQFFQNVIWTQRSNFLEVPTDCPQRDERLGWTGDAQVYSRAAMYHADVAAFFRKWLLDLRDAQRDDGGYPDFAPYPMQHGRSGKPYATAWTDAGVIVPWAYYEAYGDKRVLREHYHSMQRFLNFRLNKSPDYMGRRLGNAWGDWLAISEETAIEFIDHCYYAGSANIMANIASVLAEEAEAEVYRRIHERVRSTFLETYLNEDGTLKVETQTAYVLALWFDLIPQEKIQRAADRLAELIEANDGRMSTGFLGTRPLLPVLTQNGHFELAVQLMQSRDFPSWLYPVKQGATTVWERWDGFTKDEGFQNPRMNSFNHYAFGAVSEWMMDTLAGIRAGKPGFQTIVIKPHVPRASPSEGIPALDEVTASYRSIRGEISSAWRRDGDRLTLHVTVPANTTAEVHLPAEKDAPIRVNGATLQEGDAIEVIERGEGRIILQVPAGSHEFVCVLPDASDH